MKRMTAKKRLLVVFIAAVAVGATAALVFIFQFFGDAVRERIIELCRESNISINKLCTMSGVTQSTVNNIVSGRNNSATVSTIKKLCDGLGISIEDFFHSELFRNLEQEVK